MRIVSRLVLISVLIVSGVAGPARGQGPTLVPAALQNITPAGATRGGEVNFTLDGRSLAGAAEAVFSDPAVRGDILPGEGRNQVRVRARIGADAVPGIHRVYLHTPDGTTGAVTFAVSPWPEALEQEPNDRLETATPASLPFTGVGAIAQPGDRDGYRFRAEAGHEVVCEVVASQIRSKLASVLTLHDEHGRVLAETAGMEGTPDALLTYRVASSGQFIVRVRDLENQAGGDVAYRLNVAVVPVAAAVFPLGVGPRGGKVLVTGPNLGTGMEVTVPGSDTEQVSMVRDTPAGTLLRPVAVARGLEPEILEAVESHADPTAAQAVQFPVTVNGRLATPGETDCYRFSARKGQPVVIEVNARRLGSPLDSVIEVLDRTGGRIERATLRCLGETATALNDRDSATPALRLLVWNNLNIHDLVYVRGEVLQITALPRGPDDDVRFRAVRGQRLGLLETTPSGHALNTPVYKVQVHPPGRQFTPNGMPVFRLHYRNDDGGPLYGRDSRLTFTAPADGEYVARLSDVRGEGSPRHTYRLTFRAPRPDFRLTVNPEHPNVPAGARVAVEVTADRLDGYEGEIAVSLDGLPPGIEATSTTIEAGETSALLLLTAAADARTSRRGPPLTVVGRAQIGEQAMVRRVAVAGGRGQVTVLPPPDLVVRTRRPEITLRPGAETQIEATITRRNGFAGRVPVDVRNLPFGVRVLDVGLNGVLIPEGEVSRRFTLYCEPWVKPGTRTVYCTVRVESDPPVEVAGAPLLLRVDGK